MSKENFTNDIDRLYDAVNGIHKSLQCIICLELMKEPVKTRCGHSFCKLCAAEVLQKKPSSCPLCKKKLDRRNISKDNHLQLCIKKFAALISAIKTDSNIDILSYSKRPRDTKESCSNTYVSHSNKNSNRRISSKAQSTHQNSDSQKEKSFNNQETANNCDDQQYNLDLLNEKSATISNAFNKAGFADDINSDIPEVKVRKWLYTLPDELNDMVYLNKDDKVSMKDKPTSINQSEADSKSDTSSKTYKMNKSRKIRKKQSSAYIDKNVENASQPKKGTRARQSGKVKTIDSSDIDSNKLKYVGIHARINSCERESWKKDATKPSVEETNNQRNSTLTAATIEERDRPSLNAVNTSSANWSGVLEFGKEIRAKKKRIKKLNVSTEKNKKLPQLVENIKLSPNSQYDFTRIGPSKTIKTCGDHANVSNLLEESIGREQNAADKSPNLSHTKTSLKALTETDACNEDVSFSKDNDINSTMTSINLPMETSCITLKEGERIHIMHLNNDQVNQIIGFENSKPNSRHAENRYREENIESNVYPDLSLSSRNRLTILTPEKLDESTGCKKTTPTAAQASIRNSKSLPDLTIEDRIAGLRDNSSVKRTSEGTSVPSQSPLSGRLSLKRKPEICNNTNSPLLSQLSLADRLLINRYESDTCNYRNVDSTDKTQSIRVAAVRRHLNLDVGNIVTGSTAPRSIRNHRFPVKFIQLGTLIRQRNNVKYFYLDATKRERAQRAKFEVVTVCNMQQSISRQEMESHAAHETLRDLVASPNPSKDSQSLTNITVIENLHFADNLNSNAATIPDAKFFSALTTCKVSATSTSRIDIDRDLSRKRIAAAERPSIKANKSAGVAEEDSSQFLHKTLRAHSDSHAIRKTLHSYASSTNSVKLLSPGKDSQLKFLAIDSPTSKSEDSKASSIRQQVAVKESNFAASSGTTRKSFSESSNKKRKRTRYAGDEGLFDDWHSDDSDISFGVRTKLNKCSRSFHGEKSDLDANKKHRFSDDQISKVISNSKEQDVRKKIIPILDVDSNNTESKLSANVAENWKSHKFVTPEIKKNPQNRNELIRCPTVRKPASQLFRSPNTLENEKRKNTRSSEQSFMTKESDMFESNSIFHSDNLDFMLQEMMEPKSSKTQKITNSSNDDIINRVLQMDRSRGDPDACRSSSSATRNDRTTQSKKNSGDYLLQDNFDETIANVDLPQSEDMISSSEQPARNYIRTLVEQNMPNCLMTDEPRGATQETPMISETSSTNDIFEHSSRNVKKLSTRNASENFDKENTISHIHKKQDHPMDDRGNRKGITIKHNVSHEKEKSFNRAENLQTDKRHNVSTNSMSHFDDENNTLMNVTQDQAQLQIFEQDLFSSPPTRKKMASQNDREEQRTPKRRKLNDREENAATEEYYVEEDDIVESTPERKRKSSESNIKTVESRKSTSYSSPITITSGSSIIKMAPLDESTPKVARPTVFKQSKKDETVLSGSILLPRQTNSRTSENIRQLPDRQRLCFICTSLSNVQVSFVMELASRHNVNYVNQFDRSVTHVIVNTDGEHNAARSTLKYLQGIAHRKWIVSYRWVEDCLRAHKLLDEVSYEATTYNENVIGIEGPRNSRLRKKDLFEGFTFLCIEPYDNVSQSQYQDLLLATGATVVDSLEDLAKKGGMKGVVIQDNSTHDIETIRQWCRIAKAAPIDVEWIVDSIGKYELQKLASPYLSVDGFQAIGYPRNLLEEYKESSDGEN